MQFGYSRQSNKELRYNNSMNRQHDEAVLLLSQYDIDRFQKMIDKEREKRIIEKRYSSLDAATVSVPMKVWKGELFGGLHCSVDTVGAIESDLL